MKILFIHQNMPAQFKHLAPAMAAQGHNIAFLTQNARTGLAGVRTLVYTKPRSAHDTTHHYIRLFENSVLAGQQVVRAIGKLMRDGWTPDLVVAHPGWGEALFVKDVLPGVPLLSYCEFYYAGTGADAGFAKEDTYTFDAMCRVRARNAHLLLSLEACDAGYSPTEWQRSRHPAEFKSKIETIFDGIDINAVRPDMDASFTLPGGRELTIVDEVITYVARDLEPYRGFPSLMRALPAILAERPEATVVIVGGDGVSYGSRAPDGGSWREHMLREVSLPMERVHFLGRIPYASYLRLLQVSRLHIYLTVPFVLSWSCFEALATGCLVLGSDTPPVREVIEDGVNGLLADFHSPDAIAAAAIAALERPKDHFDLRRAARRTIVERYDLARCLPRQIELLHRVAGRPGPGV